MAAANLTQRLLTAVVLLPVAVGAILWLPTPYFALVAGALVVAGGWEWSALAGLRSAAARTGFVAALAVTLAAAWVVLPEAAAERSVLSVACLWWGLALALVVRFQVSGRGPPPGFFFRAAAGWLVLVPAWVALVGLHGLADVGPRWVLLLVAAVWAADTAAYFVGRRWGRHRLASRVSPGKSWEGVAGGLVATLLPAGLALAAGLDAVPAGALVALVLLTALASVLGDLVESLFKRAEGLKDSGWLIPGHGGVLDRIDSLTAAAPVFALGLFGLGLRS